MKRNASFAIHRPMAAGARTAQLKNIATAVARTNAAGADLARRGAGVRIALRGSMRSKTEEEMTDWYFTAPWEPESVRRGDALGFRAGADYFAELVAPGLNNGTSDARWITLMSWCLMWSHKAWEKAGGQSLKGRDAQRSRYAWLRPLELLWVARTLRRSVQATGQLRGRRSIERWQETSGPSPLKQRDSNFSMSEDQLRRFRQIGTYGVYRVAFLNLPGLTTGDGWTLADKGLQLAKLVDISLPKISGINAEPFEGRTKWAIWNDQQARFWFEKGWPGAEDKADEGVHPTPNEHVANELPKPERQLLESVIFEANGMRRATVEALAEGSAKKFDLTHADLCDVLARNEGLLELKPASGLEILPVFTRFADAAMVVMRELWNAINQKNEDEKKDREGCSIESLAELEGMEKALGNLKTYASDWLEIKDFGNFPHQQVVTSLANAMAASSNAVEQIKAIAQHHRKYGGGLRWFEQTAENLVPLINDKGVVASDYRFRLGALCKLAAQCGVADMKKVLSVVSEEENV
jgi:hypothetical protein